MRYLRPKKLDKRGCIGAPYLIIEILSPSNSNREMKNKYEFYEENGAKEHCIVDYFYKTIQRYFLQDKTYIGLKPILAKENATSHISLIYHLLLAKFLKINFKKRYFFHQNRSF